MTQLKLCQVRLSDNAAFPWILLIPTRDNIVEIIDLTSEDQLLLMQEISLGSRVLKKLVNPHKINVASLGNMVPQLHVHIIARFKQDPAWPNPVWNTVSNPYAPIEKEILIEQLKTAFNNQDLT